MDIFKVMNSIQPSLNPSTVQQTVGAVNPNNAEKNDGQQTVAAASVRQIKDDTSSSDQIKKIGVAIWVNSTIDAALKEASIEDLKPLIKLREFLQNVKENTMSLEHMLEQRESFSQKIQNIVRIVLAKRPCTTLTLQEAYKILELSDSLKLFNKNDNVATFENIFETAKEVQKEHPKVLVLIFFMLQLFDEAANWGPASAKFEASKKVILPLLHELIIRLLPQVIKEDVDLAAQCLCAIPSDAIKDKERAKAYKEVCYQFLKVATNSNSSVQPKAFYTIAGHCIELIAKNLSDFKDTVNSLVLLNAVFIHVTKNFRAHQFSFKEKYFEGCIIFLKYAQETKSYEHIQLGTDIITNHILVVISPKDVAAITAIGNFAKIVCSVPIKEYIQLGKVLMRAFTTNIALLCHSGTKEGILKAIELFAASREKASLPFKYILTACKDDHELLKAFYKGIISNINRYDYEKLSQFGNLLLIISTEHYDSCLPAVCMEWMEILSEPFRKEYSLKNNFKKLTEFHSKQEKNAHQISLLMIYIKFCLLFGNEKHMSEAERFIAPNNDDPGDGHEMNFFLTSPIVESFLSLSFDGNIVLLNRLKDRVQQRLAQKLPADCMNRGIVQKLRDHTRLTLNSKGKSLAEVVSLFQHTINLLPLYAAFKEQEGRLVINNLMQHCALNPQELFTTMTKALEMADKCKLYGPCQGTIELSEEIDPLLLAKRIRLEEELIGHLTAAHDPKIIAAFLARFNDLYPLSNSHISPLELSVGQSIVRICIKLIEIHLELNTPQHYTTIGLMITDMTLYPVVCMAMKKISNSGLISHAIQYASQAHVKRLSECEASNIEEVDTLIDKTLELLPWYGVGHDPFNQQEVIAHSIKLLFKSPKKDITKMTDLLAAIDRFIPKIDFGIEKSASQRVQEVFVQLEPEEQIANLSALLKLANMKLANPVNKNILKAIMRTMEIAHPDLIACSMVPSEDKSFYRNYMSELKTLLEKMDDPYVLKLIRTCLERSSLFPTMVKHCIKSLKPADDKKGNGVEVSAKAKNADGMSEDQRNDFRADAVIQANELFKTIQLSIHLDKINFKFHFDQAIDCITRWTTEDHFKAAEGNLFQEWSQAHFMELFDLFFNDSVASILQKKIKEDPHTPWLKHVQTMIECLRRIIKLQPNGKALEHRLDTFRLL